MRALATTSGRQVGHNQIGLGLCIALLGLGAAVLTRGTSARQHGSVRRRRVPAEVTVRACHRLHRASGLLAFSVLTDSAMEHYRGSFANKAMYTPLAVSTLTLGANLHGLADHRDNRHPARYGTYSVAVLTGIAGTLFHFYNVLKRPGGLGWQNLFYAAPLGAPAALCLSGLLGFVAERMRQTKPGTRPRVFGIAAGRALAGVAALGLLGTTGEAGLLHFRGAYHNPFMLLPVTLPPIGAVMLAGATLGVKVRDRLFTRWWLRLIAAMGLAGVGFHGYGVGRNMGGWRNWSQNVLNGPPLPAPPSFSGLALAGMAALTLLQDHPHA
jgi:hypothetical protein